tara:strand:- start:371 stop:568 length:198 start_codon:yes stop_codon:yes gene_type:complete
VSLEEGEHELQRRSKQALKLTDYFKEQFQDIPVIIAGDFNEQPENLPISNVMEANFVDLHAHMMM